MLGLSQLNSRKNFVNYLKEAQDKFQQKNYEQALILCEKAEKLNPKEERIHTLKASSYDALQETDKAIESGNLAIRCNPTYGRSYVVLGKILYANGDMKGAKEVYETGLKKVKKESEYAQHFMKQLEMFHGLKEVAQPEQKRRKVEYDMIKRLNHDVLLLLFKQLTMRDIVRMSAVSKRWREFVHSETRCWMTLDLSSYGLKITDAVFERLLNYSRAQVRVLNLRGCRAIGKPVLKRGIGQLKMIRELNLAGLSSADCLTGLINFENLEKLDVSFSRADSKSVLSVIVRAPVLKYLNITRCPLLLKGFSDELAYFLRRMDNDQLSKLDSLSLTVYKEDSSVLGVFMPLISKSLSHLTLDFELDATWLKPTFNNLKKLSKLTSLELSKCHDEANYKTSLVVLAQKNRNLVHFSGGGRLISAPLFKCLIRSWSGLTSLMLRDASINDASLRELGTLLPNLKKLQVHDCVQLTDQGLVSAVQQCHKLAYIDCSNNYYVTDVALRAFGWCEQLEYVDISSCSQVTGSGIWALVYGSLKKKHPNLKALNMNCCTRVTNDMVTKVRKLFNGNLRISANLT